MINRPTKRRSWFLVFATVAVTATIISVGVFSAKKQNPKTLRPKDWLTSTPKSMMATHLAELKHLGGCTGIPTPALVNASASRIS